MIPFLAQGQEKCLEECVNYNTSVKAGNIFLGNENYSNAVFEFLAAETASRECGCTSDEINDLIRNAINKLEDQKKEAEKDKGKAIIERAAANQKTKELYKEQEKTKAALQKVNYQKMQIEETLKQLQEQQTKTQEALDTAEVRKKRVENERLKVIKEQQKTDLALNL
jgi:uncharacterized protein (DUF3084 family)